MDQCVEDLAWEEVGILILMNLLFIMINLIILNPGDQTIFIQGMIVICIFLMVIGEKMNMLMLSTMKLIEDLTIE